MTTSTLHLNNPVPSNGAVVSSLGGRHTVTVTLAGVGAISCVVQAWGSEQGTDARKIGALVTVSGTTTVSQTLTFDADCKQFWLELVKLSPACKFNATVENDGSTSLAGLLVGPVRIEGDLEADGGSFAGLVQAHGLQLTLPPDANHLASIGLGLDFHGSSSIQQCTQPNGVVTRTLRYLSTGAVVDYGMSWSGLIHGSWRRGCPLQSEFNSGAGGEVTAQIIAGMWSDFAHPSYPNASVDCTVFQPLANDLPVGTDPRSLQRSIDDAVNRLLHEFGRKKVALLMPHTRNPNPVAHSVYSDAQLMLRQIAARYGDRVRVFSSYEILNAGGVDTPAEYIIDSYAHLNVLGGDQLYPMWMELAGWLGWTPPDIRSDLGTPVMRASGKGPVGQPDGYTGYASMTIAEGAPNEDGTTRYLLTGTGAVATAGRLFQRALLDPARPVVAGKSYRICVRDLEVVAEGAGANQLYMPGAAFHSSKSGFTTPRMRIGCFSGLSNWTVPVGSRMYKDALSDIFVATPEMASDPELIIYPGDNGYQIQCAHVDLLEVPE